jgi:hypothetical protein
VQMGDENVVKVEETNRAHKLPLRAFAAVNE